MSRRLSFGPVRTSAATAQRTSPLRLTVFGEYVVAALIGIALVGAPWLGTVVGNWLAGRL